MKRGVVVLAALVLVLVSIAFYAPAQEQGAAGKPPEESLPARKLAETGADLYMKYCSLCHGKRGEGYLADEANALANQDFLKSATDDFIIEAIVRGRPGTPMSAWGAEHGGVLAADDVLAILAFIRGWQTEEAVDLMVPRTDGDVKRGAKIYKQRCGACHGQKGEGHNALSLDNPVFQETASDGFIAYAIRKGRRQTSMPAFGSRLSPQEIADVTAFVRTLKSTSKPTAIDPNVKAHFAPESLKRALLNPGNPLAEFSPLDGRYVPADTVYKIYKEKRSFIIVDARPYNDYLRAHIEGAVSLPFYEVEKAIDYLPRDAWIIAYCVCPHAMSGKTVDALREAGFEKTAILDEGFQEWTRRGYPISTK